MRGIALMVVCLLAAAGCSGSGSGSGSSSAIPPDDGSYPQLDGLLDPYAQAKALGKGVNFGNELDAKPDEGSWTSGQKIQESDFDLAKAAGFDSVRLPVRFSAHAGAEAPYTIDPAFLSRVDEVVHWGLGRGLRVVLDLHHYEEIHQDPLGHWQRLAGIWRQLAEHYKGEPDTLYYELLNEPNGQLTAATWSDVARVTLKAVREIDAHHTVVVGAADWSNPDGLQGLVVPEKETNAIVTFHYYSPTLFTTQGKTAFMGKNWATTGISWPGPPANPVTPAAGVDPWVVSWIAAYNSEPASTNPGGEAAVTRDIAAVAAWGDAHHRPLWMSEFTAQDGAPLESRARWMGFVRTELERRGISWSIWTLDTDAGSRLYDPGTRKWSLPLTQALGLEATNP